MNIRTIVDEPRRGCGYRKQGGLYMMGGTLSAPCGKLPLELGVCPVCHTGFKPARGWTWVNACILFEDAECSLTPTHGGGIDCNCPLNTGGLLEHPRMGLLWIGEAFYKTPEDFLREGQTQGLSRRITAIPKDFKVGETWVLFAHRKAVAKSCSHPQVRGEDWTKSPETLSDEQVASCPDCKGTGIVEFSGIFSAFRPQAIEYIIKEDDTPEKLEALEKRGVTLVKLEWSVGKGPQGDENPELEESD